MQRGGIDPHSGRVPYGRGVPSWSDGTRSLTTSFAGGERNPPKSTSEEALSVPVELQEHLRTCRCTCNHMGYGNYQTLPRTNGRAGRTDTHQIKSQETLSQQEANIFVTYLRRNSVGGDRGCALATYRDINPIVANTMVTFQDLKNYKETSVGVTQQGPKFRNEPDPNRVPSCKQLTMGGTALFDDNRDTTVSKQESYKEYTNLSAKEAAKSEEVYKKENLLCISPTPTIQVGYKVMSSSPPTANHRSRAAARYQVSEYTFENDHPDSPFSEERDNEDKKTVWTTYTWHHWCVLAALLILSGSVVLAVSLPLSGRNKSFTKAAQTAALDRILSKVPLIDGHNDLAWNIRNFIHNKLEKVDLSRNLSGEDPWYSSPWSHTDLFRLVHGRIGAQFWAVYVPCGAQFLNAAQVTLEQIDLIKRMISKYSNLLGYADSHDSLLKVYKTGKVASLLGIEGGHLMGASLSILRMYYDLGVRYLTLTHSCNTPWADSSLADSPGHQAENFGLNDFGAKVVLEMNRLGMMVDLAHVSQQTMKDALAVSKAPVIFSHSAAHAICPHSRNVPDDVLKQVHLNGGIVMINFYNYFLTCNGSASVHDVIRHMNHIRDVAGIDHVGIGADFDGINSTPEGLEDVSRYPNLIIELLKDARWTEEDVAKTIGGNFLRVMKRNEEVRDELSAVPPYEDHIHPDHLAGRRTCWWT